MNNKSLKYTSPNSLTQQGKDEFKYSMNVEYNVILGCPRSGTTFLLNTLKSLPYSECISGHLLPIAIPHLVNYSLPLEIYQGLSNSFEFSVQDFLESIHQARIHSLHKWLTQRMTTTELFQVLQRRRVIERVVYKEPFLSFAPEFTYNSLPNCRIIHIYRDGRDCADSLVRKYKVLTDEKLMTLRTAEMPLGRKYDHRYVPWWVEEGREEEFLDCTPYIRAVWMWKEIVGRCHEFFSRPDVIASGRVLLLKYEDLVKNPLKHGESVVEHFGCSMNEQLRKLFKGAHQSSIGIHERRTPQEIEAAQKIAQQELELYGYLEPSQIRLSSK